MSVEEKFVGQGGGRWQGVGRRWRGGWHGVGRRWWGGEWIRQGGGGKYYIFPFTVSAAEWPVRPAFPDTNRQTDRHYITSTDKIKSKCSNIFCSGIKENDNNNLKKNLTNIYQKQKIQKSKQTLPFFALIQFRFINGRKQPTSFISKQYAVFCA